MSEQEEKSYKTWNILNNQCILVLPTTQGMLKVFEQKLKACSVFLGAILIGHTTIYIGNKIGSLSLSYRGCQNLKSVSLKNLRI